jgi:hypothetical protein
MRERLWNLVFLLIGVGFFAFAVWFFITMVNHCGFWQTFFLGDRILQAWLLGMCE